MKKRATIRDVAKKAGVSITTVSFVLKGTGRVSQETIRRVWDCVNELGYTPNPYVNKILNRENFEHKKTNLLMRVFFHPSDAALKESVLNHYIGNFETACAKFDYSGTSYAYRDILGFRSQLLLNDLVDGVVLGLPHKGILELVRNRVPCVLTGINADPSLVAMPVIHSDFEKAFSRIFSAFAAKNITGGLAVFRGYGEQSLDDSLCHDYSIEYLKRPAEKYHIPFRKEHLFNVETDAKNNRAKLEKIAEKAFHLIREEGVRFIALHLITSLTALKELLEKKGIRFPEEAILLGVNDLPSNTEGVVEVIHDLPALMEKAVEVLLRRIEGKEKENKKYWIECKVDLDNI